MVTTGNNPDIVLVSRYNYNVLPAYSVQASHPAVSSQPCYPQHNSTPLIVTVQDYRDWTVVWDLLIVLWCSLDNSLVILRGGRCDIRMNYVKYSLVYLLGMHE